MRLLSVLTTPNPDALKFTTEDTLLKEGSRSFTSQTAAENDPLAKALFALEGVSSVFYMSNFITVNKSMDISWDELENRIAAIIREFQLNVKEEDSGKEDSSENVGDVDYASLNPAQKILSIDRLLDKEIRPGLAGDGGGLEIVSLEENILQIHYEGACGTCPSSTTGTLMYIQSVLRTHLDEDLSVIPV
ncbi:MAG: NifU family protein [Planctomycetes bacterium]|nr:NifU family protein [Planctomycetota bacterium]